jgi:hypothetical protein
MNRNLRIKLKKTSRLALFAVGLLAACVPAAVQNIPAQSPPPSDSSDTSSSNPTDTSPPSPSESPTPTEDDVEEDFDDFVFVPILPYDGIRPIYEPDFVEAAESPLNEEELVMGVAIQGEAKAYPVSVLRFREMVDDELGGLPILVTW